MNAYFMFYCSFCHCTALELADMYRRPQEGIVDEVIG